MSLTEQEQQQLNRIESGVNQGLAFQRSIAHTVAAEEWPFGDDECSPPDAYGRVMLKAAWDMAAKYGKTIHASIPQRDGTTLKVAIDIPTGYQWYLRENGVLAQIADPVQREFVEWVGANSHHLEPINAVYDRSDGERGHQVAGAYSFNLEPQGSYGKKETFARLRVELEDRINLCIGGNQTMLYGFGKSSIPVGPGEVVEV